MGSDSLASIENLETGLSEVADQFRANSKLTSCILLLGFDQCDAVTGEVLCQQTRQRMRSQAAGEVGE